MSQKPLIEPRAPLDQRDLDDRLSDIRLVAAELEGFISDVSVSIGPDGGQSFGFCRADVLGLASLAAAGLAVVVMARGDLEAARPFCAMAGAELAAHKGDKGNLIQLVGLQKGFKPYEVLYCGADLDDLEAMFQVGVAACAAGASSWVRSAAHVVTRAPAGSGALRELCDLLLKHHKPLME